MNNNPIYAMKLHESIHPEIPEVDVRIIRVPGGWVYRFSELNQIVQPNGIWSENYFCDSVFVPFDNGCERK
jgi:hypothetical protein